MCANKVMADVREGQRLTACGISIRYNDWMLENLPNKVWEHKRLS